MTQDSPRTPDDLPDDVPHEVPPPPAGAVPPPAPGYSAPPPPAPGYAPPPAPGYAPPPPPAPGYGGPQGGYPPPYAVGAPLSDSDQRTWAVVAHLGTLISAILAPLIIWLVFKGRGAFVEDQSKESLNFQITFAIASVVLSIIGVITLFIGFLLFIPLGIAWLVFIIIAGVQASQGVRYRYPLTYRFIK